MYNTKVKLAYRNNKVKLVYLFNKNTNYNNLF